MNSLQLSSDFMTLLPALRRYARALTGSQEAGDELVIKTLEWLGKGPTLELEYSAKIVVFRVLSQMWHGAIGEHIREQSHIAAASCVAEERIAELDGLPRQAFLLVAMEKFGPEEASHVLGISNDEFAHHISRARREIASHAATDVLIIEDELFTAVELEMLVNGLGHHVTGKVRTHREAVEAVAKHPPGLILSDVQLADNSSGIDAVAEILQRVSLPIIFITGRPELLLTGERPEPTFLIEKPFKADEVRAVVSQAIYFKQNSTAADFAGAAVRRGASLGA